MKIIAIVSRLILLKLPKDSDLEEKPPVAIVDIACTKESNGVSPIDQYANPHTTDKAIYKTVISVAILAALGRIFSEVSELSNLNSCIPPTPRFGNIEIALTIIPMPPSHWRIARQRIIPFDVLSMSLIIVEPVVVNPETASKKESVKLRLPDEAINGRAANIDKISQLKITKIKALFISIFLLLPRLIKIREKPIKKVKRLLTKKPVQFILFSERSKKPGMSIVNDSPSKNVPITDIIGCIIIDAVFIFLLYTSLISFHKNL